MTLPLFATTRTTDDPCEGKHGGHQNSVRAWKRPGKDTAASRIVAFAKVQGSRGITLHETCLALNKEANTISGRFKPLVEAGELIRTESTRLSPSGSPETVYLSAEMLCPRG